MNPEHVAIVKQGHDVIDQWREANPEQRLDLSGANLYRADLRRADLTGANLRRADLTEANLSRADHYMQCPKVYRHLEPYNARRIGTTVARSLEWV